MPDIRIRIEREGFAMRCASCGLPLSPKRTHCPKCGAASAGEPGRQNENATSQGEVPQYAFPPPWNGSLTSQVNGKAFFFQAEDGIRDLYVTGVQTCALPI